MLGGDKYPGKKNDTGYSEAEGRCGGQSCSH